jgi:hypothetical protein
LKVAGKLKGDAPVINVVKGYVVVSPDDWDDEDAK